MNRHALEIARQLPVPIDRADIPAWLADQLREPVSGVVTVVFHSIVWQYLTDDERSQAEGALQDAGAGATAGAPLAWSSLEADGATHTDLRLTTWPAGEEWLAEAAYHVGPVRWFDRS